MPEPEFETLRETFKVIFRKEKAETTVQNFTENCTDNEIKLLELLKANSKITQVGLSSKLSLPRRIISTILSNLKEKKKIKRIGSDRNGYWEIL